MTEQQLIAIIRQQDARIRQLEAAAEQHAGELVRTREVLKRMAAQTADNTRAVNAVGGVVARIQAVVQRAMAGIRAQAQGQPQPRAQSMGDVVDAEVVPPQDVPPGEAPGSAPVDDGGWNDDAEASEGFFDTV